MKNLIAKLKSADYKQLAIDHGEKFVAGVIGMFLLFALVGTRWSGYEKTPAELKQKVTQAKTAIDGQVWANSEDSQSGRYSPAKGVKEKQVHQLLTSDEQVRISMVEAGLSKYATAAKLFDRLGESQEPVQRPEMLAVEEMLAIPVRVIIPTAAVSTEAEIEGDSPAEDGRRLTRLQGNAAGPGTTAGPMPGGQGQSYNIGRRGDEAGMVPGMGMEGGMGMGMGAQTASGLRLVSVRGIVPLFRQIESVAEALHISHRQAALLVDYWDFHLERRAKPNGGKQGWSEWGPVDLRTAEDILNDAVGWDPELIDLSLTHPVFTMSLPTRSLYMWEKNEVSHPRLDNYILSPRQRERQMQIYEEWKDQAGYVKDQEKGGLSRMQGGNRQISSMMTQAPRGMRSRSAENLLDRISKNLDRENSGKIKKELLAQIAKSQTAAGRFLLFRYLDFDVRPGTTYQYRVQLVMANPNFGKSQQFVTDPQITRERFLTTPFSQPTAEVSVPKNVNFYVTKVDAAKGSNPPSATFNVYEWSEKYGSIINKELKIQFGSFVGARTNVDVVDVGGERFREDQEVDFKSDDVLIDVFDAPGSIDIDEHADLSGLSRDILRRGLGVAEQALLVNEAGELVAYDPLSMAASYAKTRDEKKRFDEDIDPIKQKGAASGTEGPGFEGYEAAFGEAGMDPMGSGSGNRRSSGTSLRRRRGRRSRGGSPMPGIGGGSP